MDSAQQVITDQLKLVLSNQDQVSADDGPYVNSLGLIVLFEQKNCLISPDKERIMSIISVLQMAIGKIRNQFQRIRFT